MAHRMGLNAVKQTSSKLPLIARPALRRPFSSSLPRGETAGEAVPRPRRPVGAFRGGAFGFLLGSTLSGAGVYYYVLEEYRVSNELLTEDIYSLQAAIQKIHSVVTGLEERLDSVEKKRK